MSKDEVDVVVMLHLWLRDRNGHRSAEMIKAQVSCHGKAPSPGVVSDTECSPLSRLLANGQLTLNRNGGAVYLSVVRSPAYSD
jgi:hypothetical protein